MVLAQFASAWDGSGRAQFVPAWAEEGVRLVLVTDIDTCNVSASLSSVTAALSDSPVVSMERRPDAGGWRHFLFAVDGAEGKTPVFRFSLATRADRETPRADYLPVWTQDFVTWHSAPSRTVVGGMSSGYMEWQFSAPLPAGRVYVASHPLGRQADAVTFAQTLLTAHSAVASPAPSADENGVFATSFVENDASGRPIGGHPMHAIKLSWPGPTTDGRPKRKLVQLAGIHAGGESPSWPVFRACVDWMMFDTSEAAQDFRANWDVFLYFNLSPNGVYSGNQRVNSHTRTEDPNRDWDNTSVLSEIAATRVALLSDVGQCDAFLSWHTHPMETSGWIPGKNVQNNSSPDAIHAAFIATGNAIFGVTALNYGSTDASTDAWFAQARLSSKLSFHAEIGTRSGGSAAKYNSIGQNWAKTLQSVDAAGWFATSAELSASAGLAAGGSATLAASLALSAVGLVVSGGDAPVRAAVPLSAIGYALAGGNAVLDGSAAGDLQAIGGAQAGGSADLVANVTVSAEGLMQAAGAAGLTVAVLQAAAGGAQAGGDVVLSLEVQLAASGGMQTGGVAALDAGEPGSISAIGGAQAGGSAAITATVPLTAAGILQAFAAGYLVAQVDLSAVGGAAPGGAAYLSDAAALVLIESRRWVVEAAGRRWVVTA